MHLLWLADEFVLRVAKKKRKVEEEEGLDNKSKKAKSRPASKVAPDTDPMLLISTEKVSHLIFHCLQKQRRVVRHFS
jgi:hypothetical protein